ncbi:hypothetical protein JAAARDRAFT_705854 [Jaapia argillacea MUCL 33604]|uniref:Uncharacterized protein n=1 Tax=Jaapia argillacea MUCL 33604 TaxID=933084 RepID=A0A067QER1_9AGAM|nr:hypothetical protein JAAARDRAFT_705854 [Jaapia argillacea MUCL 33604]
MASLVPCEHKPRDSESRLFHRSQPLSYGDICVVRGSIALPVLKLFKGSDSLETAFSQQTRDGYEKYLHLNKPRPALISTERPTKANGEWRPTVWDLATYGNSEYHDLRRLYKAFLLAWRGTSKQWMLALDYTPPLKYWGNHQWKSLPSAPEESATHYVVEGNMLDEAQCFAEEQRLMWRRKPRQEKKAWRNEFLVGTDPF